MNLGNVVLFGLVGWAGYELYKNHNLNATTNAMKNDIMALRNRVTKIANATTNSTGTTTTNTASTTPVVAGGVTISTPNISATIGGSNQPVFGNSITGVAGSAWNSFVGQPRFTQILTPSDPNAIHNYSGTDYFSIFRPKPTAFSSYMGYKG